MPILTGAQIGELRDIVAAVLTLDDLTQLVRTRLEIRLGEIVAVPRPMLYVAFDLIDWLEPRERTRDFLRALRHERADVPRVVAFCNPFLWSSSVSVVVPLRICVSVDGPAGAGPGVVFG